MRLSRSCMVLLLGIGCGADGVPTDASGTTDASTGSSSTATETATGSSSDASTGSSDTGEEEESSSTGGPPPPPPLEWIDECVAHGVDLHVLHPEIECTSIEVPLDWEDPAGEQILVAALRVATDVEPGAGQFWVLDGGR